LISTQVGGDAQTVRAYDCLADDSVFREARWVAKHGGKVWCVAVEPKGAKFVAAGDYAGAVAVYAAADGARVFARSDWPKPQNAPFTWGCCWSGDGLRVAFGRWDGRAYVHDASGFAEDSSVRRGDRVYDVSLGRDGALLAVAGRDQKAALYRRGGVSASYALDAEFDLEAVVYAVALSYDDVLLAAGTVNGAVAVFDVETKQKLHGIAQQGAVQGVGFGPPEARHHDLAVAAHQSSVDVFRIPHPRAKKRGDGDAEPAPGAALRPRIALSRHEASHDVALSRRGLAVASGAVFACYGLGKHARGRDGCPSFDLLRSCLERPDVLAEVLKRHPHAVHARSRSGETLLQYAVRKKSEDVVDLILNADCPFGLLPDHNGHTALTVALEKERKSVVKKLLEKWRWTLPRCALETTAAMAILVQLSDKYPDVFLEFVSTIGLIEDADQAPPGNNIALLPRDLDSITAGAAERSPPAFWEPLLVLQDDAAGAAGPALASRASFDAADALEPNELVRRRRGVPLRDETHFYRREIEQRATRYETLANAGALDRFRAVWKSTGGTPRPANTSLARSHRSRFD